MHGTFHPGMPVGAGGWGVPGRWGAQETVQVGTVQGWGERGGGPGRSPRGDLAVWPGTGGGGGGGYRPERERQVAGGEGGPWKHAGQRAE